MVSAQARALDFLTRRYRESTDLVPVKKLRYPVCGVDPESWDVFVAGRKSPDRVELGIGAIEPCRLRASEHVAVNRITGEIKYLGFLGE